ncbi:MAG: cytochrome c4, partial [Sulfuritalea sp.]|nr:cytochrome c4 [Sulfuritalea sp.]
MNKLLIAAMVAALGLPALPVLAQAQKGAAAQQSPQMKRAQDIVNGRCSLCHGAEGESASPIFPRLAGQHPEYTAKQ